MRVLQVVHALPPAVYGGTELYTTRLSRALAEERDHDVAIAAPCGDAKVDVYPLPDPGPPDDAPVDGPPGADRRAEVEERFDAVLNDFDPDVVHMQHFKRLSAGLPRRCEERGIPCVGTLHDFWTICHREQLYRPDGSRCSGPESVGKCASCYADALIERANSETGDGSISEPLGNAVDADRPALARLYADRVKRRASAFSETLSATDLLISPSHFLREKFVEWGPVEHVVQCRNGIEVDAFPDTGFDPSEPIRIGYAGRITEVKGVHLLVDAFRRVNEDAELHVFGEFDPSDGYHRRLDARADDRTTFHGWYSDPAEPYEVCDMLVLPALWYENSPLVIQEAFAARLPVVTADVGGMAELVTHDRDGLHFRAGDVDSLAETLRRLAGSPWLVERLRDGIYDPKSLSEHAVEIENHYRAVLSEHLEATSGNVDDRRERIHPSPAEEGSR